MIALLKFLSQYLQSGINSSRLIESSEHPTDDYLEIEEHLLPVPDNLMKVIYCYIGTFDDRKRFVYVSRAVSEEEYNIFSRRHKKQMKTTKEGLRSSIYYEALDYSGVGQKIFECSFVMEAIALGWDFASEADYTAFQTYNKSFRLVRK